MEFFIRIHFELHLIYQLVIIKAKKKKNGCCYFKYDPVGIPLDNFF